MIRYQDHEEGPYGSDGPDHVSFHVADDVAEVHGVMSLRIAARDGDEPLVRASDVASHMASMLDGMRDAVVRKGAPTT